MGYPRDVAVMHLTLFGNRLYQRYMDISLESRTNKVLIPNINGMNTQELTDNEDGQTLLCCLSSTDMRL